MFLTKNATKKKKSRRKVVGFISSFLFIGYQTSTDQFPVSDGSQQAEHQLIGGKIINRKYFRVRGHIYSSCYCVSV